MAYATKQEMIDRFGSRELIQTTDRTNTPPTTIDDAVLNRALDDATALLDGYLSKAVALPLSPVPAILSRMCADIARYYLARAPEKDGAVARAYEQAVSWARDVSRGLIQLEVAGTAPAQPGGARVVASGGPPVLTRDSLTVI